MGKATRGKKQQQSGSVHSKIPQETNIEKVKVLSDISLPNAANQWINNNSQNSSYFTESYMHSIQPINTCVMVREEQMSHIKLDSSTKSTDINVVESVDIPVSTDLFHLIDSLDYIEDVTSSPSTNKENEAKNMSTRKSSRSSPSYESSKKRSKKLQNDVENPSILRKILTNESHVIVIADEKDEKSKSADMIFSQDDMAVVIKAANIKKKLINGKCKIDGEFACCLEQVTNLKNQIRHLSDQLSSAEKKFSDIANYRDKLAKKLEFVMELL